MVTQRWKGIDPSREISAESYAGRSDVALGTEREAGFLYTVIRTCVAAIYLT